MNLPNKLTLLRVILIPIFVVVLLAGIFEIQTARYIAAAIFAIASLTDFLDGYLARKWNMVTNFGKLMDPLADKLLVCSALICMIPLGDIAAWMVIVIIAREFIVTGLRQIALEQGIVIAAGITGKLKTVTQMLMIIFVLPGFTFIPAYDIICAVLIWAAVAATVISGTEYCLKNKGLFKAK